MFERAYPEKGWKMAKVIFTDGDAKEMTARERRNAKKRQKRAFVKANRISQAAAKKAEEAKIAQNRRLAAMACNGSPGRWGDNNTPPYVSDYVSERP